LSEELKEIKNILGKLDERISRLEASLGDKTKPIEEKKKLAVREFMLQKEVITGTDKTLVLGYYLEKFEQLDSFNVDDIERAFREAKEPVPGNINEAVNKNIRKGFMMSSGEKDGKNAWILTNSGEKFVDGLKRGT
jgi:hypothetical protein